jgi:hypothetical protein
MYDMSLNVKSFWWYQKLISDQVIIKISHRDAVNLSEPLCWDEFSHSFTHPLIIINQAASNDDDMALFIFTRFRLSVSGCRSPRGSSFGIGWRNNDWRSLPSLLRPSTMHGTTPRSPFKLTPDGSDIKLHLRQSYANALSGRRDGRQLSFVRKARLDWAHQTNQELQDGKREGGLRILLLPRLVISIRMSGYIVVYHELERQSWNNTCVCYVTILQLGHFNEREVLN